MRNSNNSSLNQYICANFVHENELLQTVRKRGEELVSGMQISPAEGKLLYVLAKMVGAKNILEIGTFVGYSTLWLAQSLPEDGKITTIEVRNNQAEIAQSHFNASIDCAKIQLLEGKALPIITTLNDAYDLIFIDAAKNEYHQYVQSCEPMLKSGGLMILDNSLLFGNVYGEAQKSASQAAVDSVNAANARLGDAQFYDGILLTTEEGLTIARKK